MVLLCARLLTDSRVPTTERALVAGAIVYAIIPFDLIPDMIPFVGPGGRCLPDRADIAETAGANGSQGGARTLARWRRCGGTGRRGGTGGREIFAAANSPDIDSAS